MAKLKEQQKKEGKIVIPHTPGEWVVSLINRLHPFQTDKDLIRLGPNYDGGYLVPNDFENIEACFSPGVDQMSGFEADCSKLGMKLFLADRSVEKPNLNLTPDKFHFLKKHIGCTSNSSMTTLDDWVYSCGLAKNSDLLLQMDIEGAEFYSLINISDSLIRRFRTMVIEFHFLENLWNPVFFGLASTVFNKILQSHSCVHIHPNNYGRTDMQFGVEIPQVAELTFFRNDRIGFKKYQTHFPHKFDCDNNSQMKHIALPKNWYRNIKQD